MNTINAIIGRYWRMKYREFDAYAAARNLRRQGVPLAIALLILVGRV